MEVRLAAVYAVTIVAIFQNYRWNSYVEAHRKDPRVWHGLVNTDSWQQSYLSGAELEELKFWFGVPAVMAADTPATTPAADTTTHSTPNHPKTYSACRRAPSARALAQRKQ